MTKNRLLKRLFSLTASTLTLLMVAAWVLTTAGRIEPLPMVVHTSIDLETPESVHEALAGAVESQRAVVLVSVNWAPMKPYREQFEEFASEWRRQRPQMPVSFHIIDFTCVSDGYAPITRLPGWSEILRRSVGHPFGGFGDYVWIRNGRVVNAGSPHITTCEQLMQTADQNLFDVNRY
jgi:hypothetical protein